eukprot:TRINITY_DN5441_c0_g1_i1.p2 TRINITY_DN5441_c0_g1~~TRINITY_DN5441_c0_g1_i1.p2  ORF type:complete len:56 (-),score=19.62 TRINITY_DN5441_c0_g1_i1:27-194(-)
MFSLDGIQKQLEDRESLSTVLKIAHLWQAKFNPDDLMSASDYESKRKVPTAWPLV